jgi:hypothetical protein
VSLERPGAVAEFGVGRRNEVVVPALPGRHRQRGRHLVADTDRVFREPVERVLVDDQQTGRAAGDADVA